MFSNLRNSAEINHPTATYTTRFTMSFQTFANIQFTLSFQTLFFATSVQHRGTEACAIPLQSSRSYAHQAYSFVIETRNPKVQKTSHNPLLPLCPRPPFAQSGLDGERRICALLSMSTLGRFGGVCLQKRYNKCSTILKKTRKAQL